MIRPKPRAPYPRESVVIHSFWRKPMPIYHARWSDSDWRDGTICDPTFGSAQCGHALPIELADKIGRPCKKCYLP